MIRTLNKRSSLHPNWCEDNLFVHEDGDVIIGAVLDGCSTGINSHFASTLVKYSLEKDVKNMELNNWTPDDAFTELVENVRYSMREVGKKLGLNEMHLLSTIVFFFYNKATEDLAVKFFGDGVVYVNGIRYSHNENNTPEYLAYHLAEDWDDFREWVESRSSYAFTDVVSFSVCTDGIDSLCNIKNNKIEKAFGIDYLLHGSRFSHLKNGLNRRFTAMTSRNEELAESPELCWWEIKDDLTVIQYNKVPSLSNITNTDQPDHDATL